MKVATWIAEYGFLQLGIMVTAVSLLESDGVRSNCTATFYGGVVFTDCRNRSLHDVPTDLLRFTSTLSLAHNSIANISHQFLTSDCDVGIGSTSCSRFPGMLLLDMSNNQLEHMSPHCLLGMEQLRVVNVSNNLLEVLDGRMFSDNRLLANIDLSGNKIHAIGHRLFQHLGGLRNLNLANNSLRLLQCDTFQGITNLKYLFINSNSIEGLSAHIFRDLGQLIGLRIDQNYLRYLPKKLLENVNNLVTFNASNNYLRYLSSTIFSGKKYLFELDISHNYISRVSRYLFQCLFRMISVNFSFNSLTYLYLSRIPVSLSSKLDVNIMNITSTSCIDVPSEDQPCFILSLLYPMPNDKNTQHVLDFSFNNISQIEFNTNRVLYSLELLKLSLAGNYDMVFPISLLKHDKYMVSMNLDETNLNWKNITLFDKIFQLPHFKSLSIVGCEACDFYMRQVLVSVFNPDIRFSITCDKEDLNDENGTLHSTFVTLREPIDNESNSSFIDECNEQLDVAENVKYSCDYPCECISEITVMYENSRGIINLDTTCNYTMDCSYSSLNVLPEIKPFTSCILMSHNNIDEVGENNFHYCYETRYLDLSFNNIRNLPFGTFNAFANLIILKLNNNYLDHLESFVFNNLTNLKVLLLHGNGISSYSADTFASMRNLGVLFVDFHNLTRFHDETLGNQSKLKVLVIRETLNISASLSVSEHFKNLRSLLSCTITGFNMNSTITNTFMPPTFLRRLELENNILPTLQDDFINPFTAMTELSLRNNSISITDKNALKYLNNLIYLDISNNLIHYIHSELLFNTTELKYLNASFNKIFCVSVRTFESLTKLENLDLSNNNIIDFSWNVVNTLPSLRKLYLDNNVVGRANKSHMEDSARLPNSEEFSQHYSQYCENYPDTISHSRKETASEAGSKLSYVSISNNYITNIEKNLLMLTHNLKYLSLEQNDIYEIDDEMFINSTLLKFLLLDHNHIASINNHLLQNLIHLEMLYLHNNDLEFFEFGAFLHLRSLKTITLSFNKLTVLDLSLFPRDNVLERLSLYNNHITYLNTSRLMPAMKSLQIFNNPLGHGKFELTGTLPRLEELDVRNTSICNVMVDSTSNLNKSLSGLNLGENCLKGLSPLQFTGLHSLFFLNISFPLTACSGAEYQLGWRNLTLINQWFEMSSLEYLILTGHPICEGNERTQIIDNLFLSEKWSNVICSGNFGSPKWLVSQNGRRVLFFMHGWNFNLQIYRMFM